MLRDFISVVSRELYILYLELADPAGANSRDSSDKRHLQKLFRTFLTRYRCQCASDNSNSEAARNARQTRTKLNQDPIYRIIRTKQTSDWIIHSRFPPHIMYSRSIMPVMCAC